MSNFMYCDRCGNGVNPDLVDQILLKTTCPHCAEELEIADHSGWTRRAALGDLVERLEKLEGLLASRPLEELENQIRQLEYRMEEGR